MKEEFLHYVWQYKKFDFSNLKTVTGESIVLIDGGIDLKQSGPDFFNAHLIIGSQKWAGTIEIHLKSSDWYVHSHEKDANYNNVILHVVWEYDLPVFREDNSELPTLELKKYVTQGVLENYLKLKFQKSWIYCENQIEKVDEFTFKNWQERLFLERLERKEQSVNSLLQETGNDWEAVLFRMLAKNFGLNSNGELFLKIAQTIPITLIRKERDTIESLEALFFGTAGLFPAEPEDNYTKDLINRYHYLVQKYQLENRTLQQAQFYRHRPDNFPTIRLAQLAKLYQENQNLFSQIITHSTIEDFYKLFQVEGSHYWQAHYQFGKVSPTKKKKLSKAFIDLLIINTIVPIRFAFAKSQGKEVSEKTLKLIQAIPSEKNNIIQKFATFGIQSQTAFESQALLQLKNEYCDKNRCLQCAVGIKLLKS